MSDLKCPNGHSVPDTNRGGETGMGVGSVAPHRTTCPECGMRLIRNPDSPLDELNRWREDDGPSGTE